MSEPCQHPEHEREELDDFGRKHEWCSDCGAMRNIVYVSRRDGSRTEEWSDWRLPTRARP